MGTQVAPESRMAPTMMSLPPPERFLLWAIRISFAPSMACDETLQSLQTAFEQSQLTPALPSFLGFVQLVGTLLRDNERLIDIHCPPCQHVGRDEWRLLQAIAALQIDNRALAENYLQNLLPPAGVRIACDCTAHLATELRALGWILQPAVPSPDALLHMRCTEHDALAASDHRSDRALDGAETPTLH